MLETLMSLARAAGFEALPVPQMRAATTSTGLRGLNSSGAYFGASGAKEFASWNPSYGSADADLLPDLDTLRARSRDLARNNGISAGAIQTIRTSVVGTGLRLSSTPDYRALGKDKIWAEEWSTGVEQLWRQWADTTECDAAGKSTFRSLTRQILTACLLNGEALALPLWLPRELSGWSTRLQIIEADRLSTPVAMADDERMRGGIEIDEFGRPIAYWIRKQHPGDALILLFGTPSDWVRIPAVTEFGRKRVIHVHDTERTGQNRGTPLLSAVIGQFRMLDHYQRTEVQSAVVNAMVAAFMETPLDPESVAQMVGSDINSEQYQQYLAIQKEYTAPLRGAAIIQAPPGTKMTPFIPGRPSDVFAPFVEAVVRHIGAGIGLPLELLLKDFSKTNYSSARAALLEAWKLFLEYRQFLADQWASPVFELWLEEAISLELIDAPDFYTERYAYSRCNWIGPGRGWIDPVKEAQAAQVRMDGGLSTLERECAEQGLDWEEVMEQRFSERFRELELEKKLGAPLFKSPQPAASQAQQPVQEPDQVQVMQ